MSRKHYIAIVAAIKEANTLYHGRDAVREIVRSLASVLKEDNASFDKEKFITACGF